MGGFASKLLYLHLMKPTIKVAETIAPDGKPFRLFKHDKDYFLYMGQRQLMCTRKTHSEEMLAEIGCSFSDKRKKIRVLIGGLGLGFSLRRALELTGPQSHCEVAELLDEVVRWNYEEVEGLNDGILADERTIIFRGDVYQRIKEAAQKGAKRYDAILLDVDDGPSALIQPQNSKLYGGYGLETIKRALTPGGRAAFWTATSEPQLLKSLTHAGFRSEEFPVARHINAKQRHHRIYLGEKGKA